MSDQRTRIGFVGVGGMGQCAHLRNYAALPGCEVAALCDVKPDMARRVAAKYAVPKVYADHEEMLAKERLDAIVAIQPFTNHGVAVPRLLAHGLPVLTEKPLAASVEMGERVVAAERDSKGWLMVAYHKRSDPATMLAKEEIERLKASGELGKMTYVRLLMPDGDWVANGFSELVRSDEPADGKFEAAPFASDMDEETNNRYVAFVNYYIHQVNLTRHLLGESWSVKHADKAGVLLAGESVSGVTCAIEMTPYRSTLDWQESALVCFERGWLKLELPAPLALNRPGKLTLFRDPGDGARPVTEIPQLPWVHAMRQQAENFLAAVRGERPPLCNAADALEDLKLAREYIRLWKGK